VLHRFYETGAGTGVGLTGMHERVRELGGNLSLESGGSGTSLLVAIPITA
jgi:signal transduction histidine kinase